MSANRAHPTRRTVVLGAVSALALARCGSSGSDEDTDGSPTSGETTASDDGDTGAAEPGAALFLVPGFADGLRTPPALITGTRQRAPLFLVDADSGAPLFDGAPDTLTLELTRGDAVVATSEVPRTGADVGKAYYPLLFELDEPGEYGVRGELAGRPLMTAFRVVDRSDVPTPAVGDRLIATETPTFDDPRGVDPVCTRNPEPCPFHETSLAGAVGTRPVVFLISTPAYCQTAICGPVLELLVEELSGNDEVAVVHGEVWRDADSVFQPGGETELMTAYGMTYEPALFVADAEGLVTARLDFTWGRDELLGALG